MPEISLRRHPYHAPEPGKTDTEGVWGTGCDGRSRGVRGIDVADMLRLTLRLCDGGARRVLLCPVRGAGPRRTRPGGAAARPIPRAAVAAFCNVANVRQE